MSPRRIKTSHRTLLTSKLSAMRKLGKKRLWSAVLLIAGTLFLSSAITILWWSKDLPDPKKISSRQVVQSTRIYDRTGSHLLYEIGEIHRTSVSLDHISPYIIQATLAAEDDQFYEHHGLDFQGILRGVVLKPLSGQRAQGGSTITQQLIKNSILTPERTVRRKVKEAVLSLELEQRFSKDEILGMYLNEIPYGSQAYGVEAASQLYFGKSSSNVTLVEAAVLAALPKAPSYYSPYGSHFEDLKRRQEHILSRMAGLGMITQQEAEEAKKEELYFQPRNESILAPHFVFYVKEILDSELGERMVEQGGLKVLTTLDMKLQKTAEQALENHQKALNSLGASNAAITAIDPKTGDILAMAGSIDYFNEDIDGNVNVAIRHRSPGSSIKPLAYAAAWQKGYTTETILVDAETNFGQDYKPLNYDLSQRGPVTMRNALANSMNIPAVKTLYLAGLKETASFAQKMGLSSLTDPDRYGLSLVLGGGEVRLVDLVSAYGVFANDGLRLPHRAILKTEIESDSDVLIDVSKDETDGEQVIPNNLARTVTDVLSDNHARSLTFGTHSPLQLGSRPVATKTGTTQDYRDGWTVGYTPSLAAGVWAGNNDNSPMGNHSPGVRTAAPVWNEFMRNALSGTTIEHFVTPEPSNNIPHGIMRGELPEIKGKWEKEAGIVYTLDCPVSLGQPTTFKELHTVLYYLQRQNPLGPPPSRAEQDPQFSRWEEGVTAWREKQNQEKSSDPEEPRYVASLPTPVCDSANSENLPKVSIVEPNTSTLNNSPVTVKVAVESDQPLDHVRFLLDGEEIAKRNPDQPLEASFSFKPDYSGRKTLLVLAVTKDHLVGKAHRTFIINPDDSPPSVTLHTPQNNKSYTPENFPITAKVTASDPSGIELVDILYNKEGQSGTRRIGRASKISPIAPNRYEVKWNDSPGPGQYTVYAIAYDKTGNTNESSRHTITIK